MSTGSCWKHSVICRSMRNDPRDVAYIFKLSKKTQSKMFQNLVWATGYNAFAILMSASTVIVAVNARLLKI